MGVGQNDRTKARHKINQLQVDSQFVDCYKVDSQVGVSRATSSLLLVIFG